jgi:hypothetical protein
MRADYNKQKKRETVYSVRYERDYDIDELIKQLNIAKEKGANVSKFSNFFGIEFERQIEETDQEQSARIAREEKQAEQFEILNKERRYEAYLALKKEFEPALTNK